MPIGQTSAQMALRDPDIRLMLMVRDDDSVAFAELVARIQALGRRSRPATPPVIERGGVRLDPHRGTVHRDDKLVNLSRKEYAVLLELLRADGGIVSTEQVLERAWDEQIDPFTNVVRFTIMKVRRKLGEPALIETLAGSGYRIP